MEFFRFCPECKRRFHIKLENKKRVSLERETIRTTRSVHLGGSNIPTSRYGPSAPTTQLLVYEGQPIIVDIEEFQYNYKCKHCEHEWSEKHTEKHREN